MENTTGEPSCEVAATGSVSSIDFKFAFKGIKGEQGETGEKGADGVAPLLQKGESALQVSYDSGEQWQDLIQLDDIKGEKGETGEKGADAPTITACEINIAGAVITGKLTFSDSSSVDITGVYTAEGGDEVEVEPEGDGGSPDESLNEETPAEGGESETPDAGEPESPAGEESPDESLNEESPEEGESELGGGEAVESETEPDGGGEAVEGEVEPEDGAGESGGETPSEGGEEE